MKKLFLVLFIFCSAATMYGQQTETLFRKARVIGVFGGPIVEIGLGDNQNPNTSNGGGIGLIIDHFHIGAYGISSNEWIDKAIDGEEIDDLDFAHGGIWLGFNIPSYKLLHLYASTRIGWGGYDIDFDRGGIDNNVFVLTPEIGVEVNVFKWFRVAGTVGYRFVDGVQEADGFGKDYFNGAIAGITFRFGFFGNWRKRQWDND